MLARLDERMRSLSLQLSSYATSAENREIKRQEDELLRVRNDSQLRADIKALSDKLQQSDERLKLLEQTGPQTVKPHVLRQQVEDGQEVTTAKTKLYIAGAALFTTISGGVGALISRLFD